MAILNEWIRIIFLVVTYGVGWDILSHHRIFTGERLISGGMRMFLSPPRGGVYCQFSIVH